VLEDDNYNKTIVYNYKSISRFVSEFRVHSAFHAFEDIHYYTSPDNVNWTAIQVSRIGVVQDVGGGWGFAKFASPTLPAGTNYLKIEVVNVKWIGPRTWNGFRLSTMARRPLPALTASRCSTRSTTGPSRTATPTGTLPVKPKTVAGRAREPGRRKHRVQLPGHQKLRGHAHLPHHVPR
jgi:hypothetical protein